MAPPFLRGVCHKPDLGVGPGKVGGVVDRHATLIVMLLNNAGWAVGYCKLCVVGIIERTEPYLCAVN